MTDIQTYDPFDEMKRIEDRIDRMFGSQTPGMGINMDMPGLGIRPQENDIVVTVDMPPGNVRKQGNDIIVTLDMPGVDEGDIDIDVRDDRILEISARRKIDVTGEEKADFLSPESRHLLYCRSIMLPTQVDKMKVTYDNGVLILTLSEKQKADDTAESQVA